MCFKTKVSLLLLALFIGAGVFSMSVQPVQAASLAELQQIIEQLKKQIIALQERLEAIEQGKEDPVQWCHNFNKNLKYGDQGAEVEALQMALTKEGFYNDYSSQQDPSKAYFDERVASAVVGFQEKYAKEVLAQWGLKHGTGFVGKSTRAKLNKLYPCGITQVKPVISSDKPYCYAQGIRRDGWYENGELIKYENCHGCSAECKAIGSKSEGWYASGNCEVDGELIKYDNCAESEELTCAAKCQEKGYDKGICRSWTVVPSAEWGCRTGELDIGRTSDCTLPEGLVGVDKTCCCQKEAEEDCAKEGESVPVVPGALECCEGLSKISCAKPDINGNCPEGCVGAFICANCGNGKCGLGENKCNCPEDCGGTGANLPPVIDGITAPTQLRVNEQGIWTIKARDPENGALSYSVNWGDEYANIALPESAPAEIDTRTQTTTFTHSYSQIGTYTIRFTVTDDHRQTAKTSTTVKIGGSEIVCTDSDGGINKYVKGRTCRDLYTLDSSSSDPTSSFGRFCRTDICIPLPDGGYSHESGTSTQGYLTEYYCSNNRIFSKTIYCENGCEDGACKREVVEPTCVDSDGGKDYYVKGVAETKSESGGGAELIDSCCSDGNDFICGKLTGSILNEAYCRNSTTVDAVRYACPNGCENGACVKGAEPYCTAIGSRSQGWYENKGGIRNLIRWDNSCDGCYAVCKAMSTRSEGWYSSCDGELIKYANCGEETTPSITVTSPDGGEKWVVGETREITWKTEGFEDNVALIVALVNDELDQTCRLIDGYVNAGQGKYSWEIGTDGCSAYYGNKLKIRIGESEGAEQPYISDQSDDYFSIVEKLCGDVNCDGVVTEDDSTLLFNYLTYGATQYPICSEWAADVNCDGSIATSDGTRIAKYVNDSIGHPLECCQQ